MLAQNMTAAYFLYYYHFPAKSYADTSCITISRKMIIIKERNTDFTILFNISSI